MTTLRKAPEMIVLIILSEEQSLRIEDYSFGKNRIMVICLWIYYACGATLENCRL